MYLTITEISPYVEKWLRSFKTVAYRIHKIVKYRKLTPNITYVRKYRTRISGQVSRTPAASVYLRLMNKRAYSVTNITLQRNEFELLIIYVIQYFHIQSVALKYILAYHKLAN